jgi:hypothetical protein
MPPAGTARHRWTLLLGHFGDHRLRGNEQTRDGGGVLQCGPHDLGRVDDALRHQVAILAGLRVIAEGVGVLVQDLANDDRAIIAGVDRDLARRLGERLLDDVNAGSLIVVVDLALLQSLMARSSATPLRRAFGECPSRIFCIFLPRRRPGVSGKSCAR